MRNIQNAIAVSVVAVSALSGAMSQPNAAEYDALNDFSTVQNPNGPWSYGEGQIGTSFLLYPYFKPIDVPYVSAWSPYIPASSVDGPPYVGINTTGAFQVVGTPPGSSVVPADALFVHPPSDSSVDTIVAWTAPTAGTYYLSGFFEILNHVPTGIIGQIYDETSPLYSQTLLSPGATSTGPGATAQFVINNLSLAAGDTLYFGVNNDGDVIDDWTGFDVTISSTAPRSAIPETSTWTMMLLGFAGLGLAGYRPWQKSAVAA